MDSECACARVRVCVCMAKTPLGGEKDVVGNTNEKTLNSVAIVIYVVRGR